MERTILDAPMPPRVGEEMRTSQDFIHFENDPEKIRSRVEACEEAQCSIVIAHYRSAQDPRVKELSDLKSRRFAIFIMDVDEETFQKWYQVPPIPWFAPAGLDRKEKNNG